MSGIYAEVMWLAIVYAMAYAWLTLLYTDNLLTLCMQANEELNALRRDQKLLLATVNLETFKKLGTLQRDTQHTIKQGKSLKRGRNSRNSIVSLDI